MKKIILVLGMIICGFKTVETKVLRFDFTVNETQTILKSLSKLPYEESAELINKIQIAAQKQLSDTTKKK